MPHSLHTAWRALVMVSAVCCMLAAHAAGVTQRVLPNGLTVLIKDVHAAPVVTVAMWYKAGSRNERPGLTGGSHLLEHMTYKGTSTFGKDEMKTLVKRNGALDNGATFYDYTQYYTTIASDRVELPIRIEASRMHEALMQQADLDAEMTVVRSELEGRENSPGSLLFQQLMSTAYAAHPYQWPVIGWRADVEHVKAATLRDYYQTYYIPNNATLVIVGDVNPVTTMALVRKYFSAIPRGPQPNQWTTPEPPQRGERNVTVRRQGQVPMLQAAWHIPDINHPDIPALMLLEQVLGSGRLSRLYRQVVETQIGVGAWANALILRDPGLFMAGGAAAPGQPIDAVQQAVLAEVERIKTTPPTEEEMARAKRQFEASLVYAQDSVTDQAEQLGYYQTIAGNWRFPQQLAARMNKITAADVSRVAQTYLTDENRTIAIFQPTAAKKPAAPAQSLTPTATPAGYHEAPKTPGMGPGKTAAAPMPKVKAPAVVASPKRSRIVLPNGMVLIVQENHNVPTVALRGNMRAGKAYDPQGQAGLADMTANLLDRGTTTRTSEEIAQELEGAAASLSASTGRETVGFEGKALKGDLALLLRNLADITRNPSFPTEELDKIREQSLAGLAMDRDDPDENARRAFYRAVLPAGHPYRAASFDEEEAGIKAITHETLRAFHRAHYTPKSMILSVVGDVQTAEVQRLVEQYFGDWQGDTPTPLQFGTPTTAQAQRVVTPITDKSEVEIYVGSSRGLRRSAPDYYAAQVMNLILGGGGALNSRLGDVIRDQNGLAYTVYSTFHASTNAGPWFTVLGVNPANTDKAVKLLTSEIVRMRNTGATDEEVTNAIAYISGATAISLETNEALAGVLMDAEYFGLGLDYPERQRAYYAGVTRAQVNAAAKQYLHPEALTISIAGPYPGK